MRVLAPSLAALLTSASALAQTSSISPADLSRGLTLPPTGAALADQATAPEVNPAGLTFLGDTQLSYLHERNAVRSLVGDGLFLSDTFFDLVGASVSVQWLRGTQIPAYRKTTYALSLGTPDLSFGAGFNFFSAKGSDLDGLSSIDLGLMSRPAKFLSMAAVVKNVDALSQGSVAFERRYDLGVGVRPIGDRYTLGADFLWGETAGPSGGHLSYTLQAEIIQGLVLGAGVAHGFKSSDDVVFQLSATVNASHLGATYALGSAPSLGGSFGDGLDHVVELRLSHEKYPTLPVNDGKIALFDLSEMLTGERGSVLSVLGFSADDPYLKTSKALELASRDNRLRAVVLKVDSLPGGLAHIDELREAVIRLRAAGKRVVAVLLSGGDREYLLASAADKIYVVPQALLTINGFSASVVFLGTAMDRIGVDWDVAKVGAYKNAPDSLTRSEMSDAQREAVNAYLDVDVRHFDQAVHETRQVTQETVRAAWKEGLLTPRRAKELGLIDDVVSTEELPGKLEELVPGARFDAHYVPGDVREGHWSAKRRIAIVPVIGEIAGGKGSDDPLGLTHVAGAQGVIHALKQAEDDRDVAAIVLRVDSPGGDGLASDLIYREVLQAKKRKPVVASMGDVAASGGYYVAMGADEIWAEPTTITGSIGVFAVKPALQRLGEKIGIREDTLQRGELADMFGIYRPWSPEERAAAQRWVDSFYDDFITEVAHSRKLDKSVVDGVARGRVWAGEDAKTRGLVDSLGGLQQAIDAARTLAHVPPGEDLDIEVENEKGSLISSLGLDAKLRSLVGAPQPQQLPDGIRTLAQQLGLSGALFTTPGLKAAMPFTLTVQ